MQEPAHTHLHPIVVLYIDKAMNVNSGYRNPVRNAMVTTATESRHIYGDAAHTTPIVDYDGNGVADAKDWDDLCSKAVVDGACVEPYSWGSGWVHMDWRKLSDCAEKWPHKEVASITEEDAKKKCKESH